MGPFLLFQLSSAAATVVTPDPEWVCLVPLEDWTVRVPEDR